MYNQNLFFIKSHDFSKEILIVFLSLIANRIIPKLKINTKTIKYKNNINNKIIVSVFKFCNNNKLIIIKTIIFKKNSKE
jgi:hypothetical protein